MDGTPNPEVENDPDLEAIRKLIETQPRRAPPAAVAEFVGAKPPPGDNVQDETLEPVATNTPRERRESRLGIFALMVLERVKTFLAQPDAPPVAWPWVFWF